MWLLKRVANNCHFFTENASAESLNVVGGATGSTCLPESKMGDLALLGPVDIARN